MDRLRTERHPGVWHSQSGDWKAMALEAEVWVETIAEGGRRFMAAWRKEEVDAARHRQEKRETTRLGKLLSHSEACVEFFGATPIGVADESKERVKEILVRARDGPRPA